MAVLSFSEIRAEVQRLCGLPDFGTGTPVTLDEVNGWINRAVRRHYGILLEQKADEYVTFDELITVSAATFDTGLLTSAEFHDVRRIFWERGTNDTVEIEPQQDRLYERSQAARAWSDSNRPAYAIVRGFLYWLPVPLGSYNVRIWYVGTPPKLEDDTDTVNVGTGWEDFIIGNVCISVANQQEEDPSRWMAMAAEGEAAMRGQKKRDRSRARQVRDTRGVRPESRHRRDRWRYPWLP